MIKKNLVKDRISNSLKNRDPERKEIQMYGTTGNADVTGVATGLSPYNFTKEKTVCKLIF